MFNLNAIRVLIPGLVLIALIACGGGDAETAALPTDTSPSGATILDEATDKPATGASGIDNLTDAVPPPVTFADDVTVEAGTDEADVISLVERVVASLRVRDIAAFQSDCHPDWQAKISVVELAASIEDESNWDGYGQHVFESAFTVEILGFKQFRDTMTITYKWSEGSVVIEPDLALVLEREDGNWWMTGRLGLCAGVGQTGTRGF